MGDAFRHRGEFRRLRYGERLVPHRLDRHYGGVGVQHDRESGEFEIIKDSLARLIDDRRLQALFIASPSRLP
ncbi:MAG: hypothetical protein ACLSTO_03645 [Bilophila wadsworthia]